MEFITQLYRKVGARHVKNADELCFNIASTRYLTETELNQLRCTLADGFILQSVQKEPFYSHDDVFEVGPRLNFATPWSSNMVSICKVTNLNMIIRVERSRRYFVREVKNVQKFIANHHDKMTECHYPEPLSTFSTGIKPEAVYDVDLIVEGPDALKDIPGISMDEWDRRFYYDYFAMQNNRIQPLWKSWISTMRTLNIHVMDFLEDVKSLMV